MKEGDYMIKEIREKKGYTQEDIARKLNISLRHYQLIEKRKVQPNVYIALKLAKLLNANPFDLFPIDNPPDRKV